MCLTVHLSLTKKFREEHPNLEEEVEIYKILVRRYQKKWYGLDSRYCCPWLHQSTYYETPWMYQEVSLDETLYAYPQYHYPAEQAFVLFDEKEICEGAIHTYRDLVTAQENLTDKDEIVVKCTAKMADFIAHGYHGDICFTKILITNEIVIIP